MQRNKKDASREATSQELLEQIYRRCAFFVHRHLMVILHREPEAWDLTQESFLLLLRALRKGKKVEHPLGFLLRTASRLAWNLRETERAGPMPSANPPESAVGLYGLKSDAEAAYERLWPLLDVRHRTLAKLYLLDEMSESEMCGITGYRRGKLRRTLFWVKKIARENNLMQFFFILPDQK